MNRITTAKTVAYLIAGIAAVSSYGHQVHLLSLADLDPLFGIIPGEWITPVTVDSLAIIALMVRMSPELTTRTRRLALIPLVFAGGMSIAANVATAHNLVQIIVGVWTVLAYILAEVFVGMMERKTVTPAAAKVQPRISDREKAARKRAGYTEMTKAEKAAWSKQYRARVSSANPVSPAAGPGSVSVEVLEKIAR